MSSVVVIGAGPAGLATSRELARLGVDHVVLERGPDVGQTWANLYDSLVLHTGKHLSALPGMPFPRSTPLFPSRTDFLEYLHRYRDRFRLPVETGNDVAAVSRGSGGWLIRTAAGRTLHATGLVLATGIVANPRVADIPGRDRFAGPVEHSVDYRRPEPYLGQRILVVGAGNSAGEIVAELAAAGVPVAIAVRSGAQVVPRQLAGVPIQYLAAMLGALPRGARRGVASAIARLSALARGPSPLPPPRDNPCSDVPLIGFHLVDAIRAGAVRLLPGVSEFTAAGARFDDRAEEPFDRIILATGYRAAIGALGGLARADECGFGRRRRRVVSLDQPDLYFVGHNYDIRGALRNIARDARLAAQAIHARHGARRSQR